MCQFQTLIMSRDSPLNIQTLILIVFIDAIMPMPELTNSYMENVPCTSKTRKILLLIIYVVIFEDNYIFVENVNTSSRSYQPIPWNCNNKIYGTEGREKQIPAFWSSPVSFVYSVYSVLFIPFLHEFIFHCFTSLFIYLFVYLFSIYLSLTNFISPYN